MRRIRFVNRVFPPSAGATGHYLAELADALAARGWSVEVVTGPASGAPRAERRASGVTVRRLSGEVAAKGTVVQRALGYMALWPRLVREAARGPAPDALVLKTDPPLLLLAGPWLRRRTGARIVHWAQDVYPDVAEALGVLPPGGLATRALRRAAQRALRRFDAVVAIGRCMAERLAGAGVSEDRLYVVPNWAPAGVHPVPRGGNPFRAEHDLDGRFVAMYSGNLGLAHPIGAMLDAAEALGRMTPDALVVFVGDGPQRAWAVAEVARRGLGNVRFVPFQPIERLAESLGAADVHLVAMDERLAGLVVPSKLYGALAAGRPVVFAGPEASEAARLVLEHDCGAVVSGYPESALGAALAAAVAQVAADTEAANAMGERAHCAAPAGPDAAAGQFEKVFRSLGL